MTVKDAHEILQLRAGGFTLQGGGLLLGPCNTQGVLPDIAKLRQKEGTTPILVFTPSNPNFMSP